MSTEANFFRDRDGKGFSFMSRKIFERLGHFAFHDMNGEGLSFTSRRDVMLSSFPSTPEAENEDGRWKNRLPFSLRA